MGAPPATVPPLLWLGLLGTAAGYSDEARGFLRALEAAGHAPAGRDSFGSPIGPEVSAADRTMLLRQAARVPGADVVAVHHHWLAGRRHEVCVNAVANVARTMFETDSVPRSWLASLLDRDQVWVPGRHAVESFERGGVPASKLRVLPGTLDFDLYSPGSEPLALEGVPAGHFVFLTNFDFQERKGWRQLLRAWSRAFHPHDPVCLLLKTGSHHRGEAYVRERIASFLRDELGAGAGGRVAPLQVMTTTLPTAEMPRLYAAADAFVLASRGEGWGRPYMEALAMGLPTIASRWGGQLEFVDEDRSWLVDGRLVPVPDDHDTFGEDVSGHRWFEPDVDHLGETLRAVAADPAAARDRARPARGELLERFGPGATAARIVELATEAAAGGRRRRQPLCVIRGDFGRNASLALVNDGLADALAARGHHVGRRVRGAGATEAPVPGISHGWPPSFDPATAGPSIAILPWEYGAPRQEWVDAARTRLDRVWVPSEYVRAGYIESGMPPGVVEVVPNGVDLEAFTPDGPSHDLAGAAGCVFLFVGGTIWRKGIDILIKAWSRAFGPDDDVLLVVKDFGTSSHYRGRTVGDAIRALAERRDVAPVRYLEDWMTPEDLPALYRAADALVAPYRGEGFGLPILEAMACGVPPIHTGTGPTAEFVDPDAGWGLPARREPLPASSDIGVLSGPGWIQEVDPDTLAETLRRVADDREDRAMRARRARARALEHGWDRAAEAAERSLATLAAEGLPLAREIPPATIEARELVVLFAPDWSRPASWLAALEAWSAAIGPEDPVTLALWADERDPAALAVEVLDALAARGLAAERLGDLALCDPRDAGLPALVALAGAVLLDPASKEPRPELLRRARRLLPAEPAALASFARELHASGSERALCASSPA